ncbi:MAG: VOC family protein [Gemmatimonadetes bacterium]|nr:VOC family protein [Gemmatimonadota bacterium]
MEIREFRATLRAKEFDSTCRFYGEILALPRLASRDGADGRSAIYQAGLSQIEVLGTPRGEGKDRRANYHSPDAPVVLTLVVESADAVYQELILRDRNIPGGLRKDSAGKTIFGTKDPDGVRILFVED